MAWIAPPSADRADDVAAWRVYAGELLQAAERERRAAKRRSNRLNRIKRALDAGDVDAAQAILAERAAYVHQMKEADHGRMA